MSWSTSELRVRLCALTPVYALQLDIFTHHSKAVLLWIFCVIYVLCFIMLSLLLIAALWSPEGKGLTWLLSLVMFIVILLLSNLVSWVRCGTCTKMNHLHCTLVIGSSIWFPNSELLPNVSLLELISFLSNTCLFNKWLYPYFKRQVPYLMGWCILFCWAQISGDKSISILYLSCRKSDLQFSHLLQTHALVL